MKQSQTTATLPTDTNTSREFDLLCACAGVQLGLDRIARITSWHQSDLDWDEFLRLAEHHGVLPLAARHLRAHAHGLPVPVEQKLQSSFDTNVRRNLWFATELMRISDEFEKRNIGAIPYKGPTLAESVYGDVALRNFSDLDFLISSADFQSAKISLEDLGYHPSKTLSPAVERYRLRNGYECSFDSAAGKYLVELQWGLLPRFYAVALRTADLLTRSQPTPLGGREVRGLSPEDLLLVLCLHAAKHLWMRLIWVCDIAETLSTQNIDWPLFCQRARELGVLRIVGVSFWLVQRLLGTSLPEPVAEIVAADRDVAILGEEFASRLSRSATYDFESTEYFWLISKLRERHRDRACYWRRLAFTPGEGDLASVSLPEAMFPLYRCVRAVRLLRRLFRGVPRKTS